jgi:hypothetical protein
MKEQLTYKEEEHIKKALAQPSQPFNVQEWLEFYNELEHAYANAKAAEAFMANVRLSHQVQ